MTCIFVILETMDLIKADWRSEIPKYAILLAQFFVR